MLYDYLQYSSRFWKINPGERNRWGQPFSKVKEKKHMYQANPCGFASGGGSKEPCRRGKKRVPCNQVTLGSAY